MFTAAAQFTPTTVTVSAYLGSTARGEKYADPEDVPMFLAEGNTLVRAANGDQTVSSSRLFNDPSFAEKFPPGSKVTVNGRPTVVISLVRAVIGHPDVDHVRVVLA
jgi:hypothetical protein